MSNRDPRQDANRLEGWSREQRPGKGTGPVDPRFPKPDARGPAGPKTGHRGTHEPDPAPLVIPDRHKGQPHPHCSRSIDPEPAPPTPSTCVPQRQTVPSNRGRLVLTGGWRAWAGHVYTGVLWRAMTYYGVL